MNAQETEEPGRASEPGTAEHKTPAPAPTASEHFSYPSVSLSCRRMFGSKPNVRGGLHFSEGAAVCYPCGRVMVLHKLEAKTQKFLHGADEAVETVCSAISQNKR